MTEDHFLNKVFQSGDLTKEELNTIIPHFKRKEYAKSEYLLEEGATSNHYWFVEHGFLRSYVIDSEGNDSGLT